MTENASKTPKFAKDFGKFREALNIGRDTVAAYFSELEEKGFIIKTMGHCLGPYGKGQACGITPSHPPAGPEANHALTFKPDQSVGADHWVNKQEN